MNLLISKATRSRSLKKELLGIAAAVFSLQPAGAQQSQSPPIDLPAAPSGFSRASAIYGAPNVRPSVGLSIAATLAASYDSNVTQGSDSSDEGAKGDYIISPGVNLAYVTEGDRFVVGGMLSSSYDQYGDVSDYSGLNYNLSGFGGYNGGKIIATFSSGIVGDRGTNRYYGDFIEQTNFSNRLIVRYALSPKTALVGNLSHQTSVVETEGYADTSSFNAGLAGFWSATPLLDVGPGFRYALRTSDDSDDKTTIGPNFNLNYQLTTKVSLRSTVGINFVDQGEEVDDSLVNWAFILNYKASELWGMNLALFRDTQSNPITGGLDEITTYRLGYQRKIRRATLNLGVGYETRSEEGADSGQPSRGFDYLTLDSSLTLPVFAESADLTFSLRYRDLSADDSEDSWNGVQTGVGILWKF